MPTLKERVRADLTTAMKARDEARTRTLRMALTSISTEEVSGDSARELSDDEVLKILGREAKRRREAATAFADAGRAEQALTEEKRKALAPPATPDPGPRAPAAMGQVMKAVTPQVAGRAEGSRVAGLV